jgi:hypothetical protein
MTILPLSTGGRFPAAGRYAFVNLILIPPRSPVPGCRFPPLFVAFLVPGSGCRKRGRLRLPATRSLPWALAFHSAIRNPQSATPFPVPGVVGVLGRANNTRPASWAAKCCSAWPLALPIRGPPVLLAIPHFALRTPHWAVPLPAVVCCLPGPRSPVPVPAVKPLSTWSLFHPCSRLPLPGSRRCLLPSWSPVPGPCSRRSLCCEIFHDLNVSAISEM